MPHRIWRASVAHPRWVFGLVGLLCLLALAAMPQVKIDTDPENMLSAEQPERVFHNQTKQRFALHDMIVVGQVSARPEGIYNPDSLRALGALSGEVSKLDGVISSDPPVSRAAAANACPNREPASGGKLKARLSPPRRTVMRG